MNIALLIGGGIVAYFILMSMASVLWIMKQLIREEQAELGILPEISDSVTDAEWAVRFNAEQARLRLANAATTGEDGGTDR